MTDTVKVLEVLEGAAGGAPTTDGGGEAGMVTTTQRGSASALDSCATTALLAFVGAGPGDPELLTLRAVTLLAGADVIAAEAGLLERLAPHLNPDAVLIPVAENERGELGELGDATVSLTPASRMKNLLAEVAAGRRVVRLTSGDPGLSGVVAAEAALCAKAGVVYEIVPGVAVVHRGAAVRRHPAGPLLRPGRGADPVAGRRRGLRGQARRRTARRARDAGHGGPGAPAGGGRGRAAGHRAGQGDHAGRGDRRRLDDHPAHRDLHPGAGRDRGLRADRGRRRSGRGGRRRRRRPGRAVLV